MQGKTKPAGEKSSFLRTSTGSWKTGTSGNAKRNASAHWLGRPDFELVHEWYVPHLERIYDDAPLRAADVAQLGQIAAGYGSRERFLTELTLDPPDGRVVGLVLT